MSNLELAWAAGFFDGEGWVTKNAGRPRPTLSVGVGQSGSPRLLERFRDAVGIGSVRGPYKAANNGQERFQYSATGSNGHRVMELLAPHLGEDSPKWTKYQTLVEEVV